MLNKAFCCIIVLCTLLNICTCHAADTSSLQQSIVLITGCSTGIGKATALKFASNPKYKVWATMRSIESFQYFDSKTVTEVYIYIIIKNIVLLSIFAQLICINICVCVY